MSAPRLHVTEAGEGRAVVLLHGLTATSRYVVHGSRALERKGCHVIAYDARGHGHSAPADTYTYADLAADLGRVLDERMLDKVVLAGVSMGAHTAIRFALEQPGRVAGLCVITPAWTEDRDPGLAGWDRLARGMREGGAEGFIAAYDFTRLPDGWAETVEKVLRQRMDAHDHPEAVADALEQVPRSTPFASVDALTPLAAMPVTVIGDRDEADPGHPLEVAERYAAAVPGARLLVEPEGESPLAWRGGQVSAAIADVVAIADWT